MKQHYLSIILFLFAFLFFTTTNAQYCACTNLGGACITNTTFNTISYTTTGCTTNPGFYTATGLSTAVVQGQTYTCTVTNDGTIYGSGIVSIWIDWDQNLVYDTYEWYQPYTAALTGSSIITVPLTATPGPRGMRVRSRGTGNPNTATDACLAMGSGETEDYVVNVISSTPCTGMPVGGSAVANPTNPCPGVTVNINLTGASLTGGLAFQWLRSTTGPTGPWVILPGATNPTLSITPPASSVTYYRCRITCTNSGLSDTSSSTAAVIIQSWSPTSPCYCGSTYTSTVDDDIGQFTFGSLLNPAVTPTPQAGNASSVNTYSNFMTLTPVTNYTQGLSYPLSIYQINSSTFQYNCWAKVFIDYNHNASFADPGEEVFSSTSDASNGFAPSGTVLIPPTSSPGQTRLRVVLLEAGSATSTGPCTNGTWGETEDYIININPAGPYDPVLSSLSGPTGNFCTDSFQTLTAQICNYGSSNISLLIHPVYVTFTVTGPGGPVSYIDTLNSGTLSAFGAGCQTASVGPVNMFTGGNYSINAVVSCPGIGNASVNNDSLPVAINILNYRPLAGPNYPLCQYNNIPFGQGLTVSGCSAPLSDSLTISFIISGPCNDGASDAASCLFGTGILPSIVAGASFTGGTLKITNLATIGSSWMSEMRFNIYGAAPTGVNIFSPGVQAPGSTTTGSTNFTYTRPVSATQLANMYTILSPGNPVNIGYWESFNDVAGSSDITINGGGTTVATLKMYYQYVPPAFAWYDVPAGGTSLYSLSPFNPLLYTNALVNNSNVTGTYTFYAACLGLPTCRVPVNLVINPTPPAFQDTISICEYAVGANNAIFILDTTHSATNMVSGGNLGASVEYYGDQALITLISNVNNDTSSTNFIYSKVFYPATGCYSSDSVYLVVNPIPQFSLPIYLGSACAPNAIDISSLIGVFPTVGIDSFYFSDPLYTMPFSNPHSIYSADTVYMIAQTNNGTGCSDSSVAYINIVPASNFIANEDTTGFFSNCGSVGCGNITLADGNTETLFTTTDCRKIATITDANDGVSLGATSICEDIDCSVQTYNSQPYVNRHYQITPSVNDSANVCLYFLNQDFLDYDAAAFPNWPNMLPASTLCITKIDGGSLGAPGSTAISIPNSDITTTHDPLTDVWTVCFPVSSFSYFYCHTCNPLNTPLPISLLSFSGKKVHGKSELNWITSSENNNSHFVVEKSKDSKTFSALSNKIPTKAISGNSNANLYYDFTDANPFDGHNYYRLQQVDIDGHKSASNVADVYFGNETMVTLFPNPVNTELNIEINTPKATVAHVTLTDAAGRIIRQLDIMLQAGNNITKVDLESVADGMYLIHISNNKGLNFSSTVHKK